MSLTVFYRMCDVPSTNPSPVYQHNKKELNLLCLRSFVQAFSEVNPKMIFICDYCDDVYKFLIGEVVPFEKEIHFTQLGINGTCLLQYEMAQKEKGNVLFQECDYVYKFHAGKHLVEAIDALGLVSPYDHKNFYLDKTIHSDQCRIALVNDYHWRTTERNTMTFAMHSDNVRRHASILNKWGYLDNEVWSELNDQGLPLWTPIPSLATHMVTDYLAPSVDWRSIWNTYL